MNTKELPLGVIAPRAIREPDTERAIERRRAEIVVLQDQRARDLQQKEAEARERVAFPYD